MMSSTKDVKQEERNWLDLPNDVMINILNRIGLVDIFENAEKVCTAWFKISKEPALWRVVNMNDLITSVINHDSKDFCRFAVTRSQGQLVDITLAYGYDVTFLEYVSERSSQLRRLEMVCGRIDRSLSDAFMKFPLLEELNLYMIKISKEEIETVGRYCPMLRNFKVNGREAMIKKPHGWIGDALAYALGRPLMPSNDEIAIAIGQNLPELKHLELIGNGMTNIGLQVILDNCLHLETLDLRACRYIDFKGDLGKQCCKQIKYLKVPTDSLED